MDLILWRHAEAEPGEPDLGRRLTAKGIQQAERMAKWLDRHLPADDTHPDEPRRSRGADGTRAEAQVSGRSGACAGRIGRCRARGGRMAGRAGAGADRRPSTDVGRSGGLRADQDESRLERAQGSRLVAIQPGSRWRFLHGAQSRDRTRLRLTFALASGHSRRPDRRRRIRGPVLLPVGGNRRRRSVPPPMARNGGLDKREFTVQRRCDGEAWPIPSRSERDQDLVHVVEELDRASDKLIRQPTQLAGPRKFPRLSEDLSANVGLARQVRGHDAAGAECAQPTGARGCEVHD